MSNWDFTVEIYWRCANNTECQLTKSQCNWHSATSSKEVVKKEGQRFCPKCGQVAVPEKWAV